MFLRRMRFFNFNSFVYFAESSWSTYWTSCLSKIEQRAKFKADHKQCLDSNLYKRQWFLICLRKLKTNRNAPESAQFQIFRIQFVIISNRQMVNSPTIKKNLLTNHSSISYKPSLFALTHHKTFDLFTSIEKGSLPIPFIQLLHLPFIHYDQ